MTQTLNLNLEIKDKEVVDYFSSFGSKINTEKALEALKVGIMAIQASGSYLESTKNFDKKSHDLQEHIEKELNIFHKNKDLNASTVEEEFKSSIQKSIEFMCNIFGDSYENTPDMKGKFLVTLGNVSSAPGTRVVFIIKRMMGVRLSEALDELEEAKQSNNALIGCYISPGGYGPLDLGESGFRKIKGNYFICTSETDITFGYKMLHQQAKFALA